MTNNQSKIEKLISELCPSGVEFKYLWQITSWDKRFNGVSIEKQKKILSFKHVSAQHLKKIETANGRVKLLATGQFNGWTTKELAENDLNDGEVITIPSGGSANIKYYKGEFVDSGNILASSIDNRILNLKYCYYYLLIRNDYISSCFRGSGVKHPDMVKILSIKIPVPPLAIQEEIVKILDNFTELEAALEAELEARKKQYEYYRKNLLTFNQDVKWFNLDYACLRISAGGDLPTKLLKGQKSPTEEFPYPIYSNGSEEKALYGFTDDYRIDNEAVTISARGTIGYHAVREAKFTPIVRLLVLIPDTKIITSKFLNYILDITEIGHSGGSIPQLTVPNVKKIEIPIPPISEQERIVSILDKFDALVNDISIGLPAELKARRQQYEYYRTRLLTFKEL